MAKRGVRMIEAVKNGNYHAYNGINGQSKVTIQENNKVVKKSLLLFIGSEYIKSTLIFFILNEKLIIGIIVALMAANVTTKFKGGSYTTIEDESQYS